MPLDLRWRLARLQQVLRYARASLREQGWTATLAKIPPRLREYVVAAPAAAPANTPGTPGAGHVLIVDALMPDPSRDSGSLRLVNLMRILKGMGWRVSFMPDNLRATPTELATLDAIGVQTLHRPTTQSLAAWLAREGSRLHAAMLCRHYVAAAHVKLLRRYAPHALIVFDTVDLHHVRESRAAELANDMRLRRQAETTRREELSLVRQCDVTLVVSPFEHDLLVKQFPHATIEVLSNIHEIHGRDAEFDEREGLVFVGGWGHPPNRDAIAWLVDEIMPRVWKRQPDMPLYLIGDVPDDIRAQLQRPLVQVLGRVPHLAPFMNRCRVALAPLRYGAGIKGKINMAMSHGLPVVATPAAVEGMSLVDGHDVLIADRADAFALAIVRLHADEALWYGLSAAAMDNVRRHFSFDVARQCLQRVMPKVTPATQTTGTAAIRSP